MTLIPRHNPRERFVSYPLWQHHVAVELAKGASPELWREALAQEDNAWAVECCGVALTDEGGNLYVTSSTLVSSSSGSRHDDMNIPDVGKSSRYWLEGGDDV